MKRYDDVLHALNKAWHYGKEIQITIAADNSTVCMGYTKILDIANIDDITTHIECKNGNANIMKCDNVTFEHEDQDAYFLYYENTEICIEICV